MEPYGSLHFEEAISFQVNLSLQIQLGLGVWSDILSLSLLRSVNQNIGGPKILFLNFLKNHTKFFRNTKMVSNESEFKDNMIPMCLLHRILKMKGLHLKTKHNINKNSAFNIPYEIRNCQDGWNPRDNRVC